MSALQSVRELIIPTPVERAEKAHAEAEAAYQAAHAAWADDQTSTRWRARQVALDSRDQAAASLQVARDRQAVIDAKKAEAERAAAEAEGRALAASNTVDARVEACAPHVAKLHQALDAIAEALIAIELVDRETRPNLVRVLEIEERAGVKILKRDSFGAPDLSLQVSHRARNLAANTAREARTRRAHGELWEQHIHRVLHTLEESIAQW